MTQFEQKDWKRLDTPDQVKNYVTKAKLGKKPRRDPFWESQRKKSALETADRIIADEKAVEKARKDIKKLGKTQPQLMKWKVGHLDSHQVRQYTLNQQLNSNNRNRRTIFFLKT